MLDLTSVATLGQQLGWTKGSGNWPLVNAAIASGKPVQIIQDSGNDQWQSQLPKDHSFQFGFPELHEKRPTPAARIWISVIQRRFSDDVPKAQWHPRVLHVGIDCAQDVSAELIEFGIKQICQKFHLAVGAIATLATTSISQELTSLGLEKGWPVKRFSHKQLADKQPCATEAAAVLSAMQPGYTTEQPLLRVNHTIVDHSQWEGKVEIAIAQSPYECMPSIAQTP